MSAALPKPARVEKWQRWRDHQGTTQTVVDVSEIRVVVTNDKGPVMGPSPSGMMAQWHFLGYAKPDKVEVGQRWRSPMREYVVESVTTHKAPSERVVNLRCESGRVLPVPLVVFGEPAAKGWEYLGMSETCRSDATKIAMPWVTRCSYCNGGTFYEAVYVYVNGALVGTADDLEREAERPRDD